MPTTPEQLVFELPHRAAMGFEDFLVSESNAAAVALIAIVYVSLNLVVDLTYGVLDPRVRVEGAA